MTIRFSAVSLDQIDRALLESQIGFLQESRTIDFKEISYGGTDTDKIECAKDLTAFANVDGGRIIIGAVAENETLKEFRPLEKIAAEKACQSIANIATSRKVDEPLLNVLTKIVDWGDERAVVVVDVPPSDRRPHAVMISENRYSFALRSDRKSDLISISEARRLFREEIERNIKSTSWVDWSLREIEEEISDDPAIMFYAAPLRLPTEEIFFRLDDWWPGFAKSIPRTDYVLPFPDPNHHFNSPSQCEPFIDRWTLGDSSSLRLIVFRRGLIVAYTKAFVNRSNERPNNKMPMGHLEMMTQYFVEAVCGILPPGLISSGTTWGMSIINGQGLELTEGDRIFPTTTGKIRRLRETARLRIDSPDPRAEAVKRLLERFCWAFGTES